MGLIMMSALMIKGNGEDVKAHPFQEKEGSKFGVEIGLWRNGHIHTMIVSTNATFKSQADAQNFGDALIKEVQEMDLVPEREKGKPDA